MSFTPFDQHQNQTFTKDFTPSLLKRYRMNRITNSKAQLIAIQVERAGFETRYERTNRDARNLFDHPQGELHSFFHSSKNFARAYENKVILDLGCGGGACVKALQKMNLNVWGVDLYLEQTSDHSTHPQQLVQGDAYQIPFRTHSFDLIYSVWSVFHYEPCSRIPYLLQECIRVLKTEGTLLISPVFDQTRLQKILTWCNANQISVFQTEQGKNLLLMKGI